MKASEPSKASFHQPQRQGRCVAFSDKIRDGKRLRSSMELLGQQIEGLSFVAKPSLWFNSDIHTRLLKNHGFD